jgi:beta-xylosidase
MIERPGDLTTALGALLVAGSLWLQPPAPPWNPDPGDGTFRNPVIHADYSDPDVVRVGSDFFMVSSSFTSVPGLPVLHSRDLVNWSLVNHALPRLVPDAAFRTPQHGAGVWAPSIRHHAGKYWIYYPDPDHGIYVIIAADPRGRWSDPVLVKPGRGLIDPCPLWDDDGTVYLVHAFARSRAGFANVLHLNRLTPDGQRVADDGRVVIDGDKIAGYTTLEGPKFYKRNGWYYIFAPAGGVKRGWQSVFRSRAVGGPYEHRIVLAQGSTDINGPHQGALVDTPNGDWWFVHFQDAEAYGRIVHMQPVRWQGDWPVVGDDADGDGTGEPRRVWRRPAVPAAAPAVPATTDTFEGRRLGLQWQWQANPSDAWWSFPGEGRSLRLEAVPNAANLWSAPNLLLQKFPAPAFRASTVLDGSRLLEGDRAGLIVFGSDYAWIGMERTGRGLRLVVRRVENAQAGGPEQDVFAAPLTGPRVAVEVNVREGATFEFAFGPAPGASRSAGPAFKASPGRWVGAKVGLFAAAPAGRTATGSVTTSAFLVAPPRND